MTIKQTRHCPASALKLLGDYVTLRIIDALREKKHRFRELQRELTDVNQVTLSRRLKVMEAVGIIKREEETIDKQSVTYELTSMGRGLLPLLHEITLFSDRFKIAESADSLTVG